MNLGFLLLLYLTMNKLKILFPNNEWMNLDFLFNIQEEVAHLLKAALTSIKMSERGVYVQASTLGSLEALLEFLRTSKIPVS